MDNLNENNIYIFDLMESYIQIIFINILYIWNIMYYNYYIIIKYILIFLMKLVFVFIEW